MENFCINLDPSDIRLIQIIYNKQMALVRVEDMKMKWKLKNEFKKATFCPHNYWIYINSLCFRKCWKDRQDGVNIVETLINILRFADDTAIMAESAEDILLESVNRRSMLISSVQIWVVLTILMSLSMQSGPACKTL